MDYQDNCSRQCGVDEPTRLRTVSIHHSQVPHHTQGCGQWVGSNRRPPRHPIPRASQRLKDC